MIQIEIELELKQPRRVAFKSSFGAVNSGGDSNSKVVLKSSFLGYFLKVVWFCGILYKCQSQLSIYLQNSKRSQKRT